MNLIMLKEQKEKEKKIFNFRKNEDIFHKKTGCRIKFLILFINKLNGNCCSTNKRRAVPVQRKDKKYIYSSIINIFFF